MRNSFICPHCGGFMEYDSSDGSSICDTCCYIIKDDGSEDFSAMDLEEV